MSEYCPPMPLDPLTVDTARPRPVFPEAQLGWPPRRRLTIWIQTRQSLLNLDASE